MTDPVVNVPFPVRLLFVFRDVCLFICVLIGEIGAAAVGSASVFLHSMVSGSLQCSNLCTYVFRWGYTTLLGGAFSDYLIPQRALVSN